MQKMRMETWSYDTKDRRCRDCSEIIPYGGSSSHCCCQLSCNGMMHCFTTTKNNFCICTDCDTIIDSICWDEHCCCERRCKRHKFIDTERIIPLDIMPVYCCKRPSF